ncbi:MAG: Asp-tRNA(Asn)/Glu-tRNA(Gln) amidotransferase subunit GatA, partial [Actinobacteria bacterium]|nr:Asp-tRNA(Asn)/Glu-tRNA(Gln) amidotransferase subunit GatA [Actinomycetota bacterium]
MSLASIARAIANKERSATEVAQGYLATIDAKEASIGAFLHLDTEAVLAQAAATDAALASGLPLGPLAGVPVAIKDNLCTIDAPTTCGSKILEGWQPPYDATVVSKLRAAGAVLVGKTNLDEFAMGSSTENSAYHPTRNPVDTSKVPGGSSGGSAAAVAADFVPAALGSDTGGSIRQPASFCGIVGVKPTYGRVSRYGLVAFASSLDQIGPFSQTVEESAQLMNVICGHDPKDSTSSTHPVPDFTAMLNKDVKGLKIGVPKELFGDSIAPDVKQALVKALDLLAANGATWEEIELNSFKAAVSTYYILAPAEASANLSRFDGVRYGHRDKDAKTLKDMIINSRSQGFGSEVKRRIILGTYVLSSGYYDAYYVRAQKARQWISQDFKKAFEKYDILVTPTAPTTAFKLGENSDNPLNMYLADIATIPVNLAGLPGMSLP